jgi:hypothetical protein
VRRACLLLLFLAGCQTPPRGAWIAWDPPDPARVEELKKVVAGWKADDPSENPITLDQLLEFDPLSAVPDQRFRAAFAQLKETDVRIYGCQLGSTGSNTAVIEFTNEAVSETEVRRKAFTCELDPERRASLCTYAPDLAYRLPGSDQVFRISDEIDPATGIRVMELLARGAYRSEIPDFPPRDWPAGWASEHAGRYLGLAYSGDKGPNRYHLSLAGCACWQNLVLEYGSARAEAEVIIVGQSMLCI